MSGKGYAILRQAGIEVVERVLADEAADAMAGYLTRSLKKRPEVILKLALSQDGMIGRPGEGQIAITGEVSRRQVHLMRAASDAILIGIGTALADDPELTVRLPGLANRSPARIVLDRNARLPLTSKLVQTAREVPLLIATCAEADPARKAELERAGAGFLATETFDGRIALPELLEDLAAKGMSSVLVEGGAATAKYFLDEGLVDRIVLFRGAVVIGEGGLAAPIDEDHMPSGFRLLEAGDLWRRSCRRMGKAALMFTGIVTDIGKVASAKPLPEGVRLRIETAYDPATIAIGASISCAGVCLTVTGLPEDGSNARWFEVEAWEEALRLTTASGWTAGTRINLERALKIGDELGGHIVSGHVDGKARIVAREDEGDAVRFTLEAPRELAKFIAPKGSVALDGTSLTVNKVEGTRFDVLLIHHSLSVTTWGERQAGDEVNLEVDTMARYAARLAEAAKEGL